jgi:hypothetical protein
MNYINIYLQYTDKFFQKVCSMVSSNLRQNFVFKLEEVPPWILTQRKIDVFLDTF